MQKVDRRQQRLTVSLTLSLIWLICVGVGVFAPSHVSGTEPTDSNVSITGQVTIDSLEQPVAGAEIIVRDGAIILKQTTTDAQGRFTLTPIPITAPYRQVDILVEAAGYGRWQLQDTPLYPGITRLLDVRLSYEDTIQTASLPLALTGEATTTDPRLPADAVPSAQPPLDSITLQTVAHNHPPTTIRVARTGHKLCSTWLAAGRPVLYVEEMPFRDYVKNVLPNEWVPSWHPQALQAGAMAVKTFAWYKILTGVRQAETNADILDNTCDQYFATNSRQISTDAAVDATWDYVMQRNEQIFPIFYRDRQERCEASGANPCLGQWQSQYAAEAGQNWQQILQTYYAPDTIFRVDDEPDDEPTPVDPFPYAYSVVSRSPSYDALHSRPAMFELVLRNEGGVPWYRSASMPGNTTGYAVHLATGKPTNPTGNPYAQPDHPSPLYDVGGSGWWAETPDHNRIQMIEPVVQPGETATFRFSATVPPVAGIIDAVFTPVVEHLGWMDYQEGTNLRFLNNPYSATVTSQQPAGELTLTPNELAIVEVQLRNTGFASWQQGSTLLGILDSAGQFTTAGSALAHSSWQQPTRPASLLAPHVAPGEVGTFPFVVQAPVFPGTYLLRVRPLAETTWWMDTSGVDAIWTVNVVSAQSDKARLTLDPPFVAATPAVTTPIALKLGANLGEMSVDLVDVTLAFDPERFDVVDADGKPTTGLILSPALVPTTTIQLNQVDKTAGTIQLRVEPAFNAPFTGRLQLATVYLIPKGPFNVPPTTITFLQQTYNGLFWRGTRIAPERDQTIIMFNERSSAAATHSYLPLIIYR